MSQLLEGRVALVTGAGAGIGRAIARAFVRAGASVVVAEYNEETGAQVATELAELGGEGLFIRTDIMDIASVTAAVEETISRWGTIDILVNNAYPTMTHRPAGIEAIDQQRLRDSMTAGFFCCDRCNADGFPLHEESQLRSGH